MNLSEFAIKLHSYVDTNLENSEFLIKLFNNISEYESSKEGQELQGQEPAYLNKFYNGSRDVPKKYVKAITSTIDEEKFSKYIDDNLFGDTIQLLDAELEKYNEIFKLHDLDVGHKCAKIFSTILVSLSRKSKTTDSEQNNPSANLEFKDGKWHFKNLYQNTEIPPAEIQDDENIYVCELYNAYADAGNLEFVNLSIINTLHKRYERNFIDQRKNYFNAKCVLRSVRDNIADSEIVFNQLKDDTFDGICDTYWDDYDNGYIRLVEVLKHVTNLPLTKPVLSEITNLIGNSEKKGICHMLVNDGKIKWVYNDDN